MKKTLAPLVILWLAIASSAAAQPSVGVASGSCSFVNALNYGTGPGCVPYWSFTGNNLLVNPPAMSGVDSPLQTGPMQIDVTYNGGGHTGLAYAFYALLRCTGSVANPGHCVGAFAHTIASPLLSEIVDLVEGGEGKVENDGAGTINNMVALLGVTTTNTGTVNTLGNITSQVTANPGNIGTLLFYNIAFPSNAGHVNNNLVGYYFPNLSGLSNLPLVYYAYNSQDPNALWYNAAGQINGSSRTAIFPTGTTYTVQALGAVSNNFVTGLGTDGVLTHAQPTEANLSMSDITTNNASTSQHGLLKKLSGSATDVLNGLGNWISAAHALLSSTHSDTVASSVVRGGIIVGNSTPAWAQLALGALGHYLRSDGSDLKYGEFTVDCGAKTLSTTSNQLQTLATIAAASNSAGAVDANITITCQDASHFNSISIRCLSSWTNTAGTVARDTPACTTTPGQNGLGTCSIGAAISGSGNTVIVTAQPVFSGITPTAVTSFVSIKNLSAGAVTCG